MYEERKYRRLFKSDNLQHFNVQVNETDLWIGASRNLEKEATEAVNKYRKQIETYIKLYPEFQTSLKPLSPEPGAAPIIVKMCEATRKAGVGPMASVAGAINEFIANELLELTEDIIIENGGDLYIKTSVIRKVGIYAGTSPLSEIVALEVSPSMTPLSICTSSGTVGHSLSFGLADAAVITSRDSFLADAVATAMCNRVKSLDDIEKAVLFASEIEGVTGALVIIGDKLSAWGDIKLVEF